MSIDSILGKLLSFQFIAATVAIIAIMSMFKHMAKQDIRIWRVFRKWWFRGFVLTPLPLILGVLIALIPKFLAGDTFGQRSIVGLAAGFFAQLLYNMFKGRVDVTDNLTTIDSAPPVGSKSDDDGTKPEPSADMLNTAVTEERLKSDVLNTVRPERRPRMKSVFTVARDLISRDKDQEK